MASFGRFVPNLINLQIDDSFICLRSMDSAIIIGCEMMGVDHVENQAKISYCIKIIFILIIKYYKDR